MTESTESIEQVGGTDSTQAALDFDLGPRVATGHWRRWEVVIAVLMVVATLARLPLRWTPLGDNALMRMWTDAVGTSTTPLVGGDARFGWDHLGPWLFYLLAVPYRILGRSAVGLLAGAAAINLISLLVVMRCVRTVAGERAAAIVTGGSLLWLLTARGDRLIDPWNPYVVQLPFLVALVSCWAVLNRRGEWLPWLVAAGSLCVQAHIAFVVPVAVLFVLVAVFAVHSKAAILKMHRRRGAVVAVVAWLPTAVDMVLPGGHNLVRVARFFLSPSSAPTGGLRVGLDVVLRETGLRASWLGGRVGLRLFTEAFDGGLGLLPGIGIAFLAGAGWWAWRRHDRVVGSLATMLAVLLPAAVAEMALGRGQLYPYLFGWVTIVGMMCWATGLIAALESIPSALASAATVTRSAAAASTLAASVLVFTGIGAPLPRSPRERLADAAIVRRLVADTESQLARGTRYHLVHGGDAYSSIYEMGVVDELRHDGYHISVDQQQVVLFGRHMTDTHSSNYPGITIIAPYEQTPRGCRLLALADPLPRTERSEEAHLVNSLTSDYERTGDGTATQIVRFADGDLVLFAGFVHPDPDAQPMLKRLAVLRSRGRSIAVVLSSTPSSTVPSLP